MCFVLKQITKRLSTVLKNYSAIPEKKYSVSVFCKAYWIIMYFPKGTVKKISLSF